MIKRDNKNKILLMITSIMLVVGLIFLIKAISGLNNENSLAKQEVEEPKSTDKSIPQSNSKMSTIAIATKPSNKIKTNSESNDTTNSVSNSSKSVVESTSFDKPKKENKETDGVITMKASLINEYMWGEKKSDRKIVFLTFDDGPSLKSTPKILDVLNKYNVKGTFFYYTMGDLKDRKDIIDKTIKEGHSIGLHSNSHKYSELYPGGTADIKAILDDYRKCIDKIRAVHPGFDTDFCRLPGGAMSWNGMKKATKVLKQWGVDNIDWNTMTGDADNSNKDKSPEGLVAYMDKTVNALSDKSIVVVLMHDADWVEHTPKALPQVIEYFKSRDYEFGIIK